MKPRPSTPLVMSVSTWIASTTFKSAAQGGRVLALIAAPCLEYAADKKSMDAHLVLQAYAIEESIVPCPPEAKLAFPGGVGKDGEQTRPGIISPRGRRADKGAGIGDSKTGIPTDRGELTIW